MLGVLVTFQYGEDYDRQRLVSIAQVARDSFESMPGLRNTFFSLDDAKQRAVHFYAWEWEDEGLAYFSEDQIDQLATLYGVRPSVESIEIVELVDNSADSID
jgi:hypothetical protein